MLVTLLVLCLLLMPALTLSPTKSLYALMPLLPAVILSPFNSRVKYYLRLVLYLSGLGVTSLWGVIVSVVCSITGYKQYANYIVARSFYKFVGPLIGVRYKIEGQEHLDIKRPYVIVGNHQSMLDILYLGAMFPPYTSIMAKKELKYAPFLGQFIALANNFFIDRGSRSDALRTFGKIADSMKERATSLFVFAEGTRNSSPTPELLPFKKGAFYCAVQGQVPIVPVVCENYWNAYSKKRFEGGEIVLKVLPPIETKGIEANSEQIGALVDRVRGNMLESLNEIASRPDSLSSIGSKPAKEAVTEK